MKLFLVMNPASRGGRSKKLFERIYSALDREGIEYDYEVTSSLNEAYELSVYANRRNYGKVVAVGGDGTINNVLNGFFDKSGKRISRSKFGVIYTGTSPDFCMSYGIPTDIDKAVKVLSEGKSRSIQIGRITFVKVFKEEFKGRTIEEVRKMTQHYESGSSLFTTRYFGCCVNIGLGADLARRANDGIRKLLGDHLGTFSALIRTLISYMPPDFDVYCDGQKQNVEKVFNISIGRTYYIASGIKVQNKLTQGDNLLYYLTVKGMKAYHLPGVVKKIYSGKEFESNDIICLNYGKVFDVCGNSKAAEIEFDGDPAGFLPCRIEVAQESLDIICEVLYEQREGNYKADLPECGKV